ncbi:hypothetical protein EG329_007286 [Mollisiaceae sp. DMI_Dod_QoI]|nr:hypothetical protein EG329_007286 [Helotiales sp. DMI_Dod_QoI]
MSDAKAEITDLLQTYAKYLNASDTSSIVPLYTKDGAFMAQNLPTALSHPSIKDAYTQTFNLITLSVTFTIHEIVLTSDTSAFARTSSEGTVTVHASGGKTNEGNQELFVLQKEDGAWKIARYCFCNLKTAIYTSFPWQPPSPTNPTTTFYLPLIFSDVVLFHATLQLSAWRLESRQQQAQQPAQNQRPGAKQGGIFAQLAAECIRLLRERVENEDAAGGGMGTGTSDQTISAVATLAAIEHERGNMRMLRMHLEGLKRMVGIRGGLNAIRETNAMVANSVFWAFAVALYELPYPSLDPVLPPFFPNEYGLAVPAQMPIVSLFQDFGPAHVDPPPLDLAALGIIPSIAMVVQSIQHVSQLVPTNAAYPTASTSLVMLTRMCTLLSHLLSLPRLRVHPDTDATNLPYSALVSESVRFATLLHVFTPWRGLPPDGTLTINHLLHQLMTALKDLLSSITSKSSTLLLWIFAVGGVSAAQLPERTWFVSHLAEMTEEMNIAGWEAMKSHVCRVIWHERLCENSHRILWGEVTAKRKELEDGMGVESY